MSSDRKNLILFTGDYPYGRGEAFLEHEIEILSKDFDEILICTKYEHNPKKVHRPLPPNVRIVGGLVPQNKKALIRKALLSFTPRADFYFLKELIKGGPLRGKAAFVRAFSGYLTLKIYLKSKLYADLLAKKNTVFYYYWGVGQVYMLPFIKKDPSNLYIARNHASDLFVENSNGYLLLRKEVYSALDELFPIGGFHAKYLHDKFGVDYSKMQIHRLGTRDYGLSPIPAQDGRITIVSCSTLFKQKRVGLIAEALMHVKNKVTWHHFGDGYMMPEIKRLTTLLPKNIKVVLHGWQPLSTVLAFYKENPVDIFINVSSAEGIPVSIMEAISFGIPCVGTNCLGATSEIVNDSDGKLLEPDFKKEELATIIDAAKNPQWRAKREGARGVWEQFYSADKNFGDFSKALRSL